MSLPADLVIWVPRAASVSWGTGATALSAAGGGVRPSGLLDGAQAETLCEFRMLP
jgi:hypothetical protein